MTKQAEQIRAATYCRISSDDTGRGAGVERQRVDTDRIAEAEGWQVVTRLVDNDRSASRHARRGREGWAQLIDLIDSGTIDAVVCYDLDRLTRQPKELERLIDASDRGTLQVRDASGDIDLTTGNGRHYARGRCSAAAHEADRASERQTRKLRHDAEAGRPHWGHRPFGYTRQATIEPTEAAIVVEMYEQVAAGVSPNAVAAMLNERGVTTTRGSHWRSGSVAGIVTSPRNIAKREHRGEVVADAAWLPIVSVDLFQRANSALRARPTGRRHGGRVALLTGLIRCSCGAIMVRGVTNGHPQYRCASRQTDPASTCSSSAAGARVDELVVGDVLTLLGDVTATPSVGRDATAADGITAEVAALRGDLEGLAEMFGRGEIGFDEFKAARVPLSDRLTAAEAALARVDAAAAAARITGDPSTLADRWADLDVALRRRIVSTVVEQVTVLPAAGRGGKFNPDRVAITWRG